MEDINNLRNELTNSLKFADNSEDLIKYFMDWILKRIGRVNISVWVRNGPSLCNGMSFDYDLLMNPKHESFFEKNVIPLVCNHGMFRSDSLQIPGEGKELFSVLAVRYMYLDELLAVVIMFRRKGDIPHFFDQDSIKFMEMTEMIFSHALMSTAKSVEEGEPPKEKKKRKQDPADWWKNGGEAPY